MTTAQLDTSIEVSAPKPQTRASGLAAPLKHAITSSATYHHHHRVQRVRAFLLAATLGPFIVPYRSPRHQQRPSPEAAVGAHWFGTDQLGRDIFSRVVAPPPRQTIAISSVVRVFALGGIAGIRGGFFGG